MGNHKLFVKAIFFVIFEVKFFIVSAAISHTKSVIDG